MWRAKHICNGTVSDVVVKFVFEQYGIEVHKYLASADLAPKLLWCERLPGSWVVVVMEKGDE